MVHRYALRKIIANAKLAGFLRRQPNLNMSQSRAKPNSNDMDFRIWPVTPFLSKPSMFSPQKILKNYEVIPIIILTGGSFIFNTILFNLRNALTRDDVRYFKNSKMHCEITEMDRKKKPKVRKFMVINEKYVTPEGLIRALEEPKPDPKAKSKSK